LKVVALAGGTGSAKLLRGLQRLGVELTVLANVGDNIWMYGAYVCPDIDVACYTLAGISDKAKGWGIEGDSFEVLGTLGRLGLETWFKLGDKDLANCLKRTELMRSGASLTDAVAEECRSLGVKDAVLPVTDGPVETRIVTTKGDLHLQEFWVRDGGRPRVTKVQYKGAKAARMTDPARRALEGADRIVVCPANPVTSVGPILAVRGVVHALSGSRARVTALSPMVGAHPFSGPAKKLMKAAGIRQDSVGVAESYSKFLDALIISDKDSNLLTEVESTGVSCTTTDTEMKRPEDETRLAQELLAA
jgi:LPPG:FO 2-phospho-L-lactate transferase